MRILVAVLLVIACYAMSAWTSYVQGREHAFKKGWMLVIQVFGGIVVCAFAVLIGLGSVPMCAVFLGAAVTSGIAGELGTRQGRCARHR